MSELALQLIAKEKEEQTGYLDLGHTGLTPDNPLLEDVWNALGVLTHLKTLILSNGYYNWNTRAWVYRQPHGIYGYNENWLNSMPVCLPHLENLKELVIGGRGGRRWDISNLSNLAGIDLRTLQISHTSIKTLHELEGLANLKSLIANNNLIKSIEELGSSTKLQEINVAFNQVERISNISKFKGLKTLNIGRNKLKTLEGLTNSDELNELFVYGNCITRLIDIDGLPNLKVLHVGSNHIGKLQGLDALYNLQSLDVGTNQIRKIENLENLTKLRSLNLNNNKVAKIERLDKLDDLSFLGIGNNKILKLEGLDGLDNLQVLNIGGNQITKLEGLDSLTLLQSLDISRNCISRLEGLEALTNLQELKIGLNQITKLEGLDVLSILQRLDVSRNLISKLEGLDALDELQHLYVNDNQVSVFPPQLLKKHSNINNLRLFGNPIKNLPTEILGNQWDDNCIKQLRDYHNDLQREKPIKNNRAKVIFIGNGGVGKTQIAKRLAEGEDFVFDAEHNSTHAIALLKHQLPCDLLPEGLELQLWDFAGQDIYHATHRLFMQTRALFVLVFDVASEAQSFHTYKGKNYRNRPLEYWLQYAQQFGKDSPVLVVQNKIDVTEQKAQLLPPPAQKQYQRKYGNITHFLGLSAKTGHDFSKLPNFVAHIFENYERLKTELLVDIPAQWIRVRNAVEQLREQGEREMSVNVFNELCQSEGVAKSADTILDFFHQTGVLFHNSCYFGNRIILNQSWAIEAVYALFDREGHHYPILEEKGGIFAYVEICKIWHRYKDGERGLFLDFMLSCELCFETTENKGWNTPLRERTFVAPQLLPETEPAYIRHWLETHGMEATHEIPYGFLPDVFIQRFIIQAHRFARVEDMWQHGILLQHDGGMALVKAVYGSHPKIVIHATPNQGEFIAAIRQSLSEISGKGKVKPEPEGERDAIAFSRDYFRSFTANPKSLEKIGGSSLKKIFVSYSHKDLKYREELENRLRPLLREKRINGIWHDHKIVPGQDWSKKIEDNLKAADIILLLISDDFWASDYIDKKELPLVEHRHSNKQCVVVPVIVRIDSYWEGSPWAEIQAVPTNRETGKLTPIAQWEGEHKDGAWREVVEGIRKLL